jgi:single-strand DNA-binding protein
MIDALISGKLIKSPALKTGQSGKPYANFLLSVAIGEDKPVIVSAMAFGEVAERIAKLQKGDAVSCTGSLKPSEWIDKATGETKHGLGITVCNVLSPYDIKKRRPDTASNANTGNAFAGKPFNDAVNF